MGDMQRRKDGRVDRVDTKRDIRVDRVDTKRDNRVDIDKHKERNNRGRVGRQWVKVKEKESEGKIF